MEDTKTLRTKLTKLFSDEELRTLCFDSYPEVYEQFSSGMTKGMIAQLLIDYCSRRNMLDQLREVLNQERPGMFRSSVQVTPPTQYAPSMLGDMQRRLLARQRNLAANPDQEFGSSPAIVGTVLTELTDLLGELRAEFGSGRYPAVQQRLHVSNLYYGLIENLSQTIGQVRRIQRSGTGSRRNTDILLANLDSCLSDLSALAYQVDLSSPASDPPAYSRPAQGLPRDLLAQLRGTLLQCDEFSGPSQLRSALVTTKLNPWRNSLPLAESPAQQVDLTIHYLRDKYLVTGENALMLFVRALSDRYDPADELHQQLTELADRLANS
jgi:hypothetical protein